MAGESLVAPSELDQLPRRERRKLELRSRVLQAAVALFDARGFHETTVSEICEQADIAQQTFFNHFPSKRDLVRELAFLSIDQLLRDIEAVRKENPSTRDRLFHLFDQVAENAVELAPMHRELLSEIISAVQESGEQAAEAHRLRDAFASIVRDGLAAGEVTTRFGEPTLTDVVMGAFYTLMFNWVNIDDYPIQEQAHEAARFLAHALSPTPPVGSEE
jgi:AcrR family transcriptional regulator